MVNAFIFFPLAFSTFPATKYPDLLSTQVMRCPDLPLPRIVSPSQSPILCLRLILSGLVSILLFFSASLSFSRILVPARRLYLPFWDRRYLTRSFRFSYTNL